MKRYKCSAAKLPSLREFHYSTIIHSNSWESSIPTTPSNSTPKSYTSSNSSPIPSFNRIRDVYLPTDSTTTGLSRSQQIAYSSLFRTFRYRHEHEKTLRNKTKSNELLRFSNFSGNDSINELNKKNKSNQPLTELLPYPPRSKQGIKLQNVSKKLDLSLFFMIFKAVEPAYHQFVELKLKSKVKGGSSLRSTVISLTGTELKCILWKMSQERKVTTGESANTTTSITNTPPPSIWDYFLSTTPSNPPIISSLINDNEKYIIIDIPESLILNPAFITKLIANESNETSIISAFISPKLYRGSTGLNSVIKLIETPWKQQTTSPESTLLADTLKTLATKNLTHSSLGPEGRLILTTETLLQK